MTQRDKNSELAIMARQGDQAARSEMIESNIKLVSFVIKTFFNFIPKNLELEEVRQYGMIGLIEAVDRFDPDKNTAFSIYATYYIKRHVRRCIWSHENRIYVPYYVFAASEEKTVGAVRLLVRKSRSIMRNSVQNIDDIDLCDKNGTDHRQETIEFVRSCIDSLPIQEREVINLVYNNNGTKTRKEIAEKLHISINHVSYLLKIAKNRIRKKIALQDTLH